MSGELKHFDDSSPEPEMLSGDAVDNDLNHDANNTYLDVDDSEKKGEVLDGANDRKLADIPESEKPPNEDSQNHGEPAAPKGIVIKDMRLGSTAISKVQQPVHDEESYAQATKKLEDEPVVDVQNYQIRDETSANSGADMSMSYGGHADNIEDSLQATSEDSHDRPVPEDISRQHNVDPQPLQLLPDRQIAIHDGDNERPIENVPSDPEVPLHTTQDAAKSVEDISTPGGPHIEDDSKPDNEVVVKSAPNVQELDINAEVSRIAELDGWERQSAILQMATTHLSANGDTDKYLADARGLIDNVCKTMASAYVGDYIKEGNLKVIALDLAKYAAISDRTELAIALFDSSGPKEKWSIYAEAFESSANPDLIADWRNQLDSEFEHTPDEDRTPEVDASRLLAIVRVSLNGLIPGDPDALSAALDYRDKLLQEAQKLDKHGRDVYMHEVTTAFAKAGIAEGTIELTPKVYGRHDPAQGRNTALTTKAVAGTLSGRERAELRLGGTTGKVLRWVDAYQKGDRSEPPNIQGDGRDIYGDKSATKYIQDQRLLQDIAPDLMIRLGITPTSTLAGLEMSIAGGDYESAREYYAKILDRESHGDRVRAALLMSRHHDEVESAGAAHNTFEGDFMGDLELAKEHITQYKRGGSGVETDKSIREELDGIFRQVSELQDPVTSLPARASLLNLFLELEPDAKQVAELSTKIESEWSTLEQRSGGDEELVAVHQQLREAGMEFARQWKFEGYIGYVPLSPLRENRTPNWEHTPNAERKQIYMVELANMKLAAERLNWYLGEQRYVLEFQDPQDEDLADKINEDVYVSGQDSAIRLSPSKHQVTLGGSWKSLYPALNIWDYKEFERAADAVRSGWQLHKNQALTQHLNDLIGGRTEIQ